MADALSGSGSGFHEYPLPLDVRSLRGQRLLKAAASGLRRLSTQ